MNRIAAILTLLPLLASGQKWTAFRADGITVYTNAGDNEARDALATLVQLRYTLSEKVGKELQPVWPITVVQRKGNASIGDPKLVRESYLVTAPAAPLPPQTIEEITRLLLRENTSTMDPAIERGIARLYSTLQVRGPRVTIGDPPPERDRDLDWARMHLLFTDTRYSGSSRVLLSNMAKGIDADAAWRNTTGGLQRDFDKQAQAYLAAGQFGTAALNGKPFDERRIRGEAQEPDESALLEADLAGTVEAYRAVVTKFSESVPAKEALGVALAEAGKTAEAKPFLEGAKGPRALAALNTRESLEKAWRANLRWSRPHEQLAALEEKQSDKAQRYRKAAELSPRDVRLWQAAAEAFEAAELHPEAAKMWFAAERAAATGDEREKLREIRLAADRKRVDADEAERRRIEEEKQKELDRLKNEAAARIREAEAKANGGVSPAKPNSAAVEWWDGPKPDARASGSLLRVDCLRGGMLRLTVGPDAKSARQFLIRDPAQVVIIGSATAQLGCGIQKPVKAVTVEYLTKTDKALGTVGDVATVTFGNSQ